jgi:hypothetical protein
MTTPPGPPFPGGYGYPPLPPPQPPRKLAIGMVFVGAPIYIALNSLLGFVAFLIAGSSTDSANVILGAAAVMLALIAFGGGAALLAVRNPQVKGIGLGLMVGWALTSLVSVGFCTGINPALYSL